MTVCTEGVKRCGIWYSRVRRESPYLFFVVPGISKQKIQFNQFNCLFIRTFQCQMDLLTYSHSNINVIILAVSPEYPLQLLCILCVHVGNAIHILSEVNQDQTRLWLVLLGECVVLFFLLFVCFVFCQCVLVIVRNRLMCNIIMFGYQQSLCSSLSKSIKI